MNKLFSKKNFIIAAMCMSVMWMVPGCGSKDNSSDSSTADKSNKESVQTDENATEDVTIKVGGLLGPTSMGLVKLMEDSANGECANTYEFADMATDPSAFVAPLAKGEIDIAALPSNLASVIYNNTDGKVQVIAVNTLCVLDIVERGESISSVADLKGKTLYATGQGATPEYTLRYLLGKNAVDPDKDVTIKWCADTTEALSYVTNDENAIAMLPQPFVTVAMSKVEGLRIALDLNEEWNKVNSDCSQVTGVLVVRKEFAEKYPANLAKFMEEYEASVKYLDEKPDEGAGLIEKYGIVGAAVATKALDYCHIVCLTGDDMKNALAGFLNVLYEANPQSVGGKLPGDDFYYIGE